jgi:hypothetical protein
MFTEDMDVGLLVWFIILHLIFLLLQEEHAVLTYNFMNRDEISTLVNRNLE